jgi:peroxiredoxin
MQEGDLVENLTLPDQDGNTVNLTDFVGKLLSQGRHPRLHH